MSEQPTAVLSYARIDVEAPADKEAVLAVIEGIEQQVHAELGHKRFELWRDVDGIRPGEMWREALYAAIGQAHVLIVLLSRGWLNSDECWREFETFRARPELAHKTITVYPAQLRDIPLHQLTGESRERYDALRAYQFADWRDLLQAELEGQQDAVRATLQKTAKNLANVLEHETTALSADFEAEGLSQLDGVIPDEIADCEKINQLIDKLLPEFCDHLPPGDSILELLTAILKIAEQNRNAPEKLKRLENLAELKVAKRFGGQEVARLRRELRNREVINALTEPFSGAEMRMAAAEDRAVEFCDDGSRDPCGIFHICPPPSVGIEGVLDGADVGGRLGLDLDEALNCELQLYKGHVDSPKSKEARREVLVEELEARIADQEPRYYYVCRDDDDDWKDTAHMLRESFKGTVPCMLLSLGYKTDDRAVMRALLKIQKICRKLD